MIYVGPFRRVSRYAFLRPFRLFVQSQPWSSSTRLRGRSRPRRPACAEGPRRPVQIPCLLQFRPVSIYTCTGPSFGPFPYLYTVPLSSWDTVLRMSNKSFLIPWFLLKPHPRQFLRVYTKSFYYDSRRNYLRRYKKFTDERRHVIPNITCSVRLRGGLSPKVRSFSSDRYLFFRLSVL